MLRQLRQLTNNVVPHSIMIGFEQVIIAALNLKLNPLVPQKLCLFRYSKNIHRYVQELRLSMAASGFLRACRASHGFAKVHLRILGFT